MRIVFWNIQAGGGSRIEGIARQIAGWSPTVVALAEFRGTPASRRLAHSLSEMGYIHQLTTADPRAPATNALLLAALCPLEPLDLPSDDIPRARWLPAIVHSAMPFTVGVMHIPNSVTGFKAPYYRGILALLDGWTWARSMLIGDTNSGMPDIDEENRAFTAFERDWLQSVTRRGWVDCFRQLHGDERAYTWYSPNGGNGFRLDQAFLNAGLMGEVRAMRYDWGMTRETPRGPRYYSDHAAIVLDLQQ